jgi:hypothetical protein
MGDRSTPRADSAARWSRRWDPRLRAAANPGMSFAETKGTVAPRAGLRQERPAVRSARVAIVRGLLVVAGQVRLHRRSYCFGRVQ